TSVADCSAPTGSTNESVDLQFSFNGSCPGPGNIVNNWTLTNARQSITFPSSITPIDTTFVPWQYENGSSFTTGVGWNPNFSLCVRKHSTDSNFILVEVQLLAKYSRNFSTYDGGENIPCSMGLVEDASGNIYSICDTITQGGAHYLYDVETNGANRGHINFLGLLGGFTDTGFSNVKCGGNPL